MHPAAPPAGTGNGDSLSRRRFLALGLAAAGAAAGGVAPRAWASSTEQLWGLDPSWGGAGCLCGGCAACRAHAENRLFASAAAADAGRAHPFCKCLVVPVETVDRSVYAQLFVAAGGREAVDRRHQWVRSVLARRVPPPPAGPPPAPATLPDGYRRYGRRRPGPRRLRRLARPGCPIDRAPAAADGAVRASFRARIRQRSGGRRVLVVEIKARQAVDAHVVLGQRGRPLAERTVRCIVGRRTIVISLPRRLSPGRAHLDVELCDRAGDAKVATRVLQIPARVDAKA